jgi:hypothetical protein
MKRHTRTQQKMLHHLYDTFVPSLLSVYYHGCKTEKCSAVVLETLKTRLPVGLQTVFVRVCDELEIPFLQLQEAHRHRCISGAPLAVLDAGGIVIGTPRPGHTLEVDSFIRATGLDKPKVNIRKSLWHIRTAMNSWKGKIPTAYTPTGTVKFDDPNTKVQYFLDWVYNHSSANQIAKSRPPLGLDFCSPGLVEQATDVLLLQHVLTKTRTKQYQFDPVLFKLVANSQYDFIQVLFDLMWSPDGDSTLLPLPLAIRTHNYRLMQILVDAGAEIMPDEATSRPDNQPMVVASGDAMALTILMPDKYNRASPHTTPPPSATALAFAIFRRSLMCVQWLLNANAPVHGTARCTPRNKNFDGVQPTPFNIAIALDNAQIMAFLLHYCDGTAECVPCDKLVPEDSVTKMKLGTVIYPKWKRPKESVYDAYASRDFIRNARQNQVLDTDAAAAFPGAPVTPEDGSRVKSFLASNGDNPYAWALVYAVRFESYQCLWWLISNWRDFSVPESTHTVLEPLVRMLHWPKLESAFAAISTPQSLLAPSDIKPTSKPKRDPKKRMAKLLAAAVTKHTKRTTDGIPAPPKTKRQPKDEDHASTDDEDVEDEDDILFCTVHDSDKGNPELDHGNAHGSGIRHKIRHHLDIGESGRGIAVDEADIRKLLHYIEPRTLVTLFDLLAREDIREWNAVKFIVCLIDQAIFIDGQRPADKELPDKEHRKGTSIEVHMIQTEMLNLIPNRPSPSEFAKAMATPEKYKLIRDQVRGVMSSWKTHAISPWDLTTVWGRFTPLTYAVDMHDYNLMRTMILAQVPTDHKWLGGPAATHVAPILEAAHNADTLALALLLANRPLGKSNSFCGQFLLRKKYVTSPLIEAVNRGSLVCVQLLLNANFSPLEYPSDAKDSLAQREVNAVERAIELDNVQMMAFLVDYAKKHAQCVPTNALIPPTLTELLFSPNTSLEPALNEMWTGNVWWYAYADVPSITAMRESKAIDIAAADLTVTTPMMTKTADVIEHIIQYALQYRAYYCLWWLAARPYCHQVITNPTFRATIVHLNTLGWKLLAQRFEMCASPAPTV